MFRKLHRWFSLPLCLFVVLVLLSGVALQVEETIGIFEGGEESSPVASQTAPPVERLTDAEIRTMVGEALSKSKEQQPDFRATRIELDITPGREFTRLAVQPRGGPYVTVDRASGETDANMNPAVPMHVWFIRLHTGTLAGPLGILIMLVTSLALMFLAVSGLVLYYQMWANRKNRGRRKLFWH
ncbi:PepSY-associated TM helix domain-containing protein [Allopontixanthobacter sediminis]|uniref:PepSY-associated TM region n=1 Tax=Allopontixanthobacter sediminis TaxID=1689985 RepID=A0A845B6I6_9SPHN|nr:PepSY-associated TM helix domain-containing protein [Allopontixanthobacter sediminis]MXP45766.1 hypothetical protein [Allopontixanthobacter sediminis]